MGGIFPKVQVTNRESDKRDLSEDESSEEMEGRDEESMMEDSSDDESSEESGDDSKLACEYRDEKEAGLDQNIDKETACVEQQVLNEDSATEDYPLHDSGSEGEEKETNEVILEPVSAIRDNFVPSIIVSIKRKYYETPEYIAKRQKKMQTVVEEKDDASKTKDVEENAPSDIENDGKEEAEKVVPEKLDSSETSSDEINVPEVRDSNLQMAEKTVWEKKRKSVSSSSRQL